MSVRFSGEHVGNDTPHDPEELVRRVCEDALGSVRYEPASSGFCRVCTRAISFYAGNRDYGVLHADFGYGSHLDGNRYHLNLCDDCFQSTLDFLAARARLLRGVDSPTKGPSDWSTRIRKAGKSSSMCSRTSWWIVDPTSRGDPWRRN